jgi:hypothetical protein
MHSSYEIEEIIGDIHYKLNIKLNTDEGIPGFIFLGFILLQDLFIY